MSGTSQPGDASVPGRCQAGGLGNEKRCGTLGDRDGTGLQAEPEGAEPEEEEETPLHVQGLNADIQISSVGEQSAATIQAALEKNESNDENPARQGQGDEAPDELRAALEALPRHVQLALRRDLAITPFEVALRTLQESGPYEAAVEAMTEAGDEVSVRQLHGILGRNCTCWCFSRLANKLDTAHNALKNDDVRSSLLQALRRVPEEGPVSAAVKRHVDKDRFDDVYKVERSLLMLWLGAAPDEQGVLPGPGSKAKTKPRGKAKAKAKAQDGKGEDEAPLDSEEARMSKKQRKRENNATLKFLEEFRAKRQRLRESQ